MIRGSKLHSNNGRGSPSPKSYVARILPPMTPKQIVTLLETTFAGKIIASFPDDKHPRVHVNASDWREIAQYLYREPALKLDWLQNLSGVDYVADEKMCVVYDVS